MIIVAVLTLSDKGSKGERADTSGPLIQDMLKSINAEVKFYDILPDEKELIKKKLIGYSEKVDLILTTGGTGLSPRDVTPEATLEVIDRQVPGITEAMRSRFKKDKPGNAFKGSSRCQGNISDYQSSGQSEGCKRKPAGYFRSHSTCYRED